MSIKTNENYHASVIEIHGRFLGSVDGPEFEEAFNALQQAGKTNVVIDLGKTDFMDSTGVGVLISSHTSIRKQGGDVRLANLKKRIKNLFMMMHLLGKVFESYDSVEAAARSFEEQPPEVPTPEPPMPQ